MLDDYVVMGADTLHYGKEYSRALMEYYAEHHTTVAMDVTLNGQGSFFLCCYYYI